MSLDDEDPKLAALMAGASINRLTFLAAVEMLHLAIAVAIEAVDEALEGATVRDRIASALEVAVPQLQDRLSEDERDQYRRLHKYFLERLYEPFGNTSGGNDE